MQEICIIAFVLLAFYGLYAWLTGPNQGAELTQEVSRMIEANKHNAPIVYLRSFASNTLQLADFFKNGIVGHPIAGTPAFWKDAGHIVTAYLQVIAPMEELTSPEVSAGLAWELEQVVRLVSPTKVLLVLPPTQGEYDQIRAGTEGFFPVSLPIELPASRLMTFNSNWQPYPLPVPGQLGLWQALEPVFLQNGYEAPPWRRI